MAWYSGAIRDEIPENDSQASITPTQFIVHSVIAPWTADRIGEYWRDSTNLESHFGLGYGGDLNQYVSTTVRADANAQANVRAVSIETASNTSGTDPWTQAQVDKLVALGVWLHEVHGIPAVKPASWTSPGMGYHRLHPEWSVSGTSCPGDARVAQFNNVVLPAIQAQIAGGTPPPDPEPEGFLMTEFLNSSNATDVPLGAPSQFVGLAFGPDRPNGPAVIHGAGWKHDTKVHLYFDYSPPPGSTVIGRFYLTDPDGVSGKSNFLDERFALVGGGVVFTNVGIVPENKHLRFEVMVNTPNGTAVTLLHRLATGFYEVA